MIRNKLPLIFRQFVRTTNRQCGCALLNSNKVLLHTTSATFQDSKFWASNTFREDHNDADNQNAEPRLTKKINIKSFASDSGDLDEFLQTTDNENFTNENDGFSYTKQDERSTFSFEQDDQTNEWLSSLLNLKQKTSVGEKKPFVKKLIEYNNDIDEDTKMRCKNFLKDNDISLTGNSALHPALEFEDVQFSQPISNVLNRMKFKNPTSIQSVAWPQLLSGNNLVGIAQTGSGKTLGFVAPAIEHILQNERSDDPRVVIMCPTRELALQCSSVVHRFAAGTKLKHATVYGGEDKGRQLDRLHCGVDLLVATPGRLLDFMNTGDISLDNCSFLVFDEADRMLDMGFKPQIDIISKQIRPDRQVAMWSATWPLEIQDLAHSIVSNDFVHIKVGSGELTPSSTVAHFFKPMQSFTQKKVALVEMINEIIQHEQDTKIIVFTETKHTCDALDLYLRSERFRNHIAIHGGKKQGMRTTALKRFRSNDGPNVLLATSVAARGLDIPEVKFVINFDMPMNAEEYVHRIGRAGRMGRQGYAVSFLSMDNLRSGHFPKLVKNLKTLIENGGQEPPEDLETILRASRRLTQSRGGARSSHRTHHRKQPRHNKYDY